MSDADVLGGLGGVIGGLFGNAASEEDRKAAEEYLRRATGAYEDLKPNITASQEQLSRLGPSSYNTISYDPSGRNAQLDALNQLKSIYSQGGLDPAARAQQAEAQAASENQAQAMNSQVRNAMAQRGLSSSGANFAAQRSNAQAAANSAAMQGMQALQAQYMRQLGATAQAGQLGGQVRGQDYGQAADRARANDSISAWNAQNAQGVNSRNSDRDMLAQEQTFQNGLGRAGGLYQGYSQQAGGKYAGAQNTMNQWTGAGQAVGAAIGRGGDKADEMFKSAASSGGGGGGGMGSLMAMF